MKYKISEDQERKLQQFAGSNYAELFVEIFRARVNQINKQFRVTLPESFQEVKGRALEVDALIDALKIQVLSGE